MAGKTQSLFSFAEDEVDGVGEPFLARWAEKARLVLWASTQHAAICHQVLQLQGGLDHWKGESELYNGMPLWWSREDASRRDHVLIASINHWIRSTQIT